MSGDGGPQTPVRPGLVGNHSKLIRHLGGFEWEGVPVEAYKETTETWKGISRRELAGTRGESTRFHVRYFEIRPGGFSTLEKHDHEHVVYVVRGRGEARTGCFAYRVAPGDVVYVAPGDPHQFLCPDGAEQPFGFLCIVNAERDRPTPVDGLGACEICE